MTTTTTDDKVRPDNSYGTIRAEDAAHLPPSQVRLLRLSSTRRCLDEAGVEFYAVFVGWDRWDRPSYAGWVIDGDWADKLDARKRARAANPPARTAAQEAAAAERAAKTRVTRALRKLADAGDPYAGALQQLRAAQRASDRAKSRAATGTHWDDFYGSHGNYIASRDAIRSDYLDKDIALRAARPLLTAAGITWGWGSDTGSYAATHVLYVDLPTGQISFHQPARGDGPDYEGTWDGVRDVAEARIEAAIAELVGA